MKLNIIFLILLNLLIFNLHCADSKSPNYSNIIIKINSFMDIENILLNIEQETLLIFDIDETLIEAANMICRPQFLDKFLELQDKYFKNFNLSQKCKEFLDKKILIEPYIKDIIDHLQKKHIPIIGLTTRNVTREKANDMLKLTYNCLNDLGINFNNLSIENFDIVDYKNSGATPKFYNGIIFTDATSKGYALYSFLYHTGIKLKKIIFIDDIYKNLLDVKNMIEFIYRDNNNQLPKILFYGYHYNFVKNNIHILDEEAVKWQFEFTRYYGKWLSDIEIKELIEENADYCNPSTLP